MSIIAYFYNYTYTSDCSNDPDGWVVCDGLTRTVTDGRFAIIAPLLNTIMGVTSNTANSITPPNLQSQFLYGSSSTSSSIGSTGGTSSVTLNVNQMPSHSHTVNDPGHDHSYNFISSTHSTNVTYNVPPERSVIDAINTSSTTTGISNTGITLDPSGGGQPVTILPPYMHINYIMKY
jgi:microcystin-dependent protein